MTMISDKLLITKNKKPTIPLPGPSTLATGNLTTGYYGEVLPGDLISGTDLANAVGITTKTNYFPNASYLKFSYDNKTLFIPKQPFFINVSWRALYLCGAVYGNDTTGRVPTGVTPTVQNRRVIINGVTYRVRLMRAVNTDPYTTNTYNIDNPPNADMSEWERLIMGISNGTLGNLTAVDLGVNTSTTLSASAVYSTYCQESHPLGSATYRIVRGFTTISKLGTAVNDNAFGWRPVLEPI